MVYGYPVFNWRDSATVYLTEAESFRRFGKEDSAPLRARLCAPGISKKHDVLTGSPTRHDIVRWLTKRADTIFVGGRFGLVIDRLIEARDARNKFSADQKYLREISIEIDWNG